MLVGVIIALFFSHEVLGQKDSLILVNGDVIVGEFKDMDRGVLNIETDYSKDDFRIEWTGIDKIYSVTFFLITLSDGSRYNSTIRSTSGDSVVFNGEGIGRVVSLADVVYLKPLKQDFMSKINAAIDIGYSFTKANNFSQLTMRSNIGYMANKWSADASYNTLYSTQDEIDPIHRVDGGLAFRQYLPHDWYLPVDLTFLSNTEQQIQLRTNAKVGVGNYIIHTNSSYWGLAAGVSTVSERFDNEEPDRYSLEGYFGSELNLYDIGDLSLLTKLIAYPGITESGRWRVDFVFDTKYDLPLDFYIKLGFTLNYDNQPVETAPKSDYVFATGFGWEW
jgi:hypothetical protein